MVRGFTLNELPEGTPTPWSTYANLYTLANNASQEYYPMEGYLGGSTSGTPTPYFSLLEPNEQKFETAQDSMATGNYSYAAVKLQDAALYAEDPAIRRASITSLMVCLSQEDLSSMGLQALFTALKDSTYDNMLKRKCQSAIARIYRVEDKSDFAIQLFESIMNETNVTSIDSANAVKSAMAEYIYMASQRSDAVNDLDLSTALSNVTVQGSYSWLKPSSINDYNSKCKALDELLDPMYIKETTISDTTEWGLLGLVILKNNLTILQNAQLTILPGTTILGDGVVIDVYGELISEGTVNDTIKFAPQYSENGIKVVFHDGSSSNSSIEYSSFNKSTVALDIQEELTNPITDVTFNNCDIGIYCSNATSTTLNVSDCTFESDGNFTDKGIQFFNGASGSEIYGCKFFGAMRPIIADNITANISANYIENTDTVQTTAEIYGIELYNMNGKVSANTVKYYPSGILLKDSDPSFFHNYIDGCNSEGLRLVSDSYPDMTDGGSGGMNWFKGNGYGASPSPQVRIDGSLYPFSKNGANNFWVCDSSEVAFKTNSTPKDPVNLAGNYWGTYSTTGSDLFSPFDSKYIDFSNYLTSAATPTGGYTTASAAEDLELALQYISNEEFEQAMPILENIIFESDSSSEERLGSVSLLADLYLIMGEDSAPLRTELIDLAAQTDDTDLAGEALNTTARLNIEAGNYQDAIDHYTTVLSDPDVTPEDSLCAVMNSAYAYLRSQGQSGVFEINPDREESSSVKSRSKETDGMKLERVMRPASVGDYMASVQDILAKLREVESNTSRSRNPEIPDKFALHQNYPNPFNPSTTIRFDMPINADVKIAIYNVLGREVMTVLDTKMNAGAHSINVNMQNYASGLYFYSIETSSFKDVKKMLMIK